MTDEEKQRYVFQQWWENKKDKVNELFGIGGKYETTNITFKLGIQPKSKIMEFFTPKSMMAPYNARTAWGKHHTPEHKLFTGSKAIDPIFGIDELSFFVYYNPNPVEVQTSFPGHEWKHVMLIFDCVKNSIIVPTGADQHKIIGFH